ncbi:MAG: PrgI family protein [Clostridia bacterium]|nr:PrgI family protein [Clostridia bacterium]
MAYQIPRNVKGEGRILFIFSTKALIATGIGAGIGLIFWLAFKAIGLGTVGIIILIALAVIGFGIGTLKVPNTTAFDITRKTGGENIDDVIIRWIKFKMKSKKKIYVYTEGGTKDDR